jgi:hypothetical protein
VRFFVARDAILGRRKVDGTFLASELNTRVALQAIDALDHMGAVLERMVLPLLLETQHLGACACKAGEEDQYRDEERPNHFFPSQVRW